MDFSNITLGDLNLNFEEKKNAFGPPSELPSHITEQFDGKIFKPYNKKERLGKLMEFTLTGMEDGTMRPLRRAINPLASLNLKQAAPEEDVDAGFEQASSQRKGGKAKNQQRSGDNKYSASYQLKQDAMKGSSQRIQSGYQAGGIKASIGQTKKNQKYQARVQVANNNMNKQSNAVSWNKRGYREQSIEIKREWQEVKQFTNQMLDKAKDKDFVDGYQIASAGCLYTYNDALEKCRINKPKKLPVFKGEVSTGSLMTAEDPIIQRLAQEDVADIFCTDVALSALMCAPKAQFAWDLQIDKCDDWLFVDKRQELNILDKLTIAETAQADYQSTDDDTISGTRNLMDEATSVNKSWVVATQMKDKAPKKLDEEDPHIEHENQIIARVGYVYRLWKTKGFNPKRILVRCAVHAWNAATNEQMNLYALHEWNQSRQQWSKELDTQGIPCLTREIADNQTKFMRWAIASILGGVKQMRFGFLQRVNDNVNTEHKIVGTQTVSTRAFATQLNLNMRNCWAIASDLFETLYSLQEPQGTFLFIREVSSSTYKLIKKSEDEDESGEENSDE